MKILGDRTLDEIHNTRLFRLKQRTLPWHFDIAHLPGRSNHAADATSRHPSPVTEQADMLTLSEASGAYTLECALNAAIRQDTKEVTSLNWDDIAAATLKDVDMAALATSITIGFPADHKNLPHTAPYCRCRDHLYVSDGVVMYDDRVVIPRSLRRHVLANLHAAHQGQSSMDRVLAWNDGGHQQHS